jgi:hypothetical protein
MTTPVDPNSADHAAACNLLSEILRNAFWHVGYHELELAKAHRKAAAVHALLQRCDLLTNLTEARKTYDAMDDVDDPRSVDELARTMLVEAADTIEHHEQTLRESHTKLAHAKALLQRTNFHISLTDLEDYAKRQLNERDNAA